MNRVTAAILARGERRNSNRAHGSIAAEFERLRTEAGLFQAERDRLIDENRRLRAVIAKYAREIELGMKGDRHEATN